MKISARLSLLLFAAWAGMASSCSRHAENRPLNDAMVVLSSTRQDARLPLKHEGPRLFGDGGARIERTSQVIGTGELFRMVDQLLVLSDRLRNDQLSGLGGKIYREFYENPENFAASSFMEGPIPKAITGQGQEPVLQEVERLRGDMKDAVTELGALLQASERSYPWPARIRVIADAVGVLDRYLDWLLAAVEQLPISGKMKVATQTSFREQHAKLRPALVDFATGMQTAKRLKPALGLLKRSMAQFGVTLRGPTAVTLKKAELLSAELEDMETAQDALSILVSVWRMLPPRDRGEFKKLSPKLYEFFQDKSEDDLDCLKYPHCPRLILGISKAIIFKNLEKYGLEKIRDEVDAGVTKALVTSVTQEVQKLLPQVPRLVRERLVAETNKFFALFDRLRADFPGFAMKHMEAWARERFKVSLRGVEAREARVSITDGALKVEPAGVKGPATRSGAEVLGGSLSLAHAFLPEDRPEQLRAALAEPIMKLLSIGGFRLANGRPFPNFLLPIDDSVEKISGIDSLMKGVRMFAVPDEFLANGLFQMDRSRARRDVSVTAQAELLKGLARQIHFHRDWEQNVYDTSLGAIKVSEVVPEIPGEGIRTPLMPKDLVFSLALANAGLLLQNLVMELSPAFLVLEGGEILWGNRYQEITGNKVSTIAGIVSIVDGKRSAEVHTADVARFALALDEFVAATEGLENSRASVLTQKKDGGQGSLLTDFLEVRQKLRLLQMGLANFLVNHSIRRDGLAHASFRVATGIGEVPAPVSLEDQALTIRALLASAKRLNLPLYRWHALDVYFGANHRMFDPKRQFYSGAVDAAGKGIRSARLPEIISMLLAGEELAEFMPADSKKQWDRLAGPWLKAIEGL